MKRSALLLFGPVSKKNYTNCTGRVRKSVMAHLGSFYKAFLDKERTILFLVGVYFGVKNQFVYKN